MPYLRIVLLVGNVIGAVAFLIASYFARHEPYAVGHVFTGMALALGVNALYMWLSKPTSR